ncbi:hypothetical protein BO70DRAFT_432288 [Aspergillus heteromorphus CBS 117.55]|uniref:Wax synthase domain-containing protein n=1 Tax=Aspergillus heteromorphus CBS 117.55 TaxID=1448321 RepID=A0A317VA74_9EURO|nr:uncharacterized protein BO70DRAFT_432288 [Aspergillus heteromorphus CBS 117.55]PWY70249.1 hypothetical protein BO70DRAFT_432288 [Aspergillus heteromorphus CBS 117.55]
MAAPSYRQFIRDNHDQFESLIQNGTVQPVLLWHLVLPVLLPIVALLIPRPTGPRHLRPLVLGCIIALAIDFIRRRRMLLGGNGYMGGLVPAWWCIWSATLLVFHDAERDFRRLERRPGQQQEEVVGWQTYPSRPFSHRLNWVLGLLTNMRGPEWNWRISSLGPLPASVQSQLDSPTPRFRPEPDDASNPPPPPLRLHLRAVLALCLQSYLALDLIKLLMIRDHYFMGLVTDPPTPPFPFTRLSPSPFLVQAYRSALTGLGVLSALTYVTSFNPLLFGGLSLAFPRAARAITSTPLDVAWLYPPTFGSFLPSILDAGLVGVWSHWWHQIFRFGFISTARALTPAPHSTHPLRPLRRVITLLVAFSLSGALHACGSYAQFRPTHPISGTYRFFILQAVGILLQEFWCRTFLPRVLGGAPRAVKLPGPVRRAGNAAFALGWLLFTGRFIADDFSRGGLWLTEPLPGY